MEMKKYLFYLGHPAHYHYISHLIKYLGNKGHEILLVVREKDVLTELLKNVPFEKKFLPPRKGKSKIALITSILSREYKIMRIVQQFKPDLMTGTDIAITHIGRLMKIPSIVISEDDAAEIPQFVKWGYRYATHILAPAACDCTPYNYKKISFPGYLELAYLHPLYFKPDRSVVNHLFSNTTGKYFLIRLAQLSAFHDKGKRGIPLELVRKMIDMLSSYGNVYLSAERKLPEEFKDYRLPLQPNLIHHALSFAEMYIGDSQTMACEAAVLGTPALRFNDFVGKLGYLEELQHNYDLTYGISASEPQALLDLIKSFLEINSCKEIWAEKRDKMLNQCIDVNMFMNWLIEDYPDSAIKWINGSIKRDKFTSSLHT